MFLYVYFPQDEPNHIFHFAKSYKKIKAIKKTTQNDNYHSIQILFDLIHSKPKPSKQKVNPHKKIHDKIIVLYWTGSSILEYKMLLKQCFHIYNLQVFDTVNAYGAGVLVNWLMTMKNKAHEMINSQVYV